MYGITIVPNKCSNKSYSEDLPSNFIFLEVSEAIFFSLLAAFNNIVSYAMKYISLYGIGNKNYFFNCQLTGFESVTPQKHLQ